MEKRFLSATSINLFLDCPRCFWFAANKKIYRPRGPMPSITIGVDSEIKKLFNYYRNIGKLPPFLDGKISGRLISDLPHTMYANFNPEVTLFGYLDEAIQLDDGSYVPFDHKTKNKKVENVEDVHPAYRIQTAVYVKLLEEKFKKVQDYGYLAYYFPVYDISGKWIVFENDVKKLDVKNEIGLLSSIVGNALKCVNNDVPEPSEKCEYCNWSGIIKNQLNAGYEISKEPVNKAIKETEEEFKGTLF
jgi:hypothetical protein